MRRIVFDEKQIEEIRNYMESGHTLTEGCNRFTLKMDTFRRVLEEHSIKWVRQSGKMQSGIYPQSQISLVCHLFRDTDTRLADIVNQSGLYDYQVKIILRRYFTEEEINRRKSRLYRKSKSGEKNPMKKLTGSNHPNYVGEDISDGNGYLMRLKPDWYTGRKGCRHVYTHNLVICQALGLTQMPEGFVVHHIDGNPLNNALNNLALLSAGAHCRLHHIQRKLSQRIKVQRLSDNGVGGNSETPDNDCHASEVVEDIVQSK